MYFTLCSEHEGENSFSVRRVEMEIFVLAKALGSHTWRHQLFEIPIKPFPFSWHWNWKRHDGVAYVCDCVCVCVCVCVRAQVRVWQELTKDVRALCWVCRDRWEVLSTSVQETACKSLTSHDDFPLLGFLHTHVYSRKDSIFVTVSASLLLLLLLLSP